MNTRANQLRQFLLGRTVRLCKMALISLLSFFSICAYGSDYPNKPVRLVVPFDVGGTTDILGRLIATELAATLGQPVVVENRPGAGSNIGTDVVAKAAPDGYTLLLASPAIASNGALYGSLPFDPNRDLTPLSLLAEIPIVLVVNPELPVHSVEDLISYASRHPGDLNFGSSGNGGIGHLTGEMLKSMTKIDIVHVPFKGNGPALNNLISGFTQLTFSDLVGALPHIQSGKLRAIAITGVKRSPLLPDTPTMIESGVDGFVATSWFGLFVTGGTPKQVLNTLGDARQHIFARSDFTERLRGLGFDVVGSSADQFRDFYQEEIVKWTDVVTSSGATVN